MSPEFEQEPEPGIADAVKRGIAEGRLLERAAIVADLRTHKWHPGGASGAIRPETAALRYERSEHLEP